MPPPAEACEDFDAWVAALLGDVFDSPAMPLPAVVDPAAFPTDDAVWERSWCDATRALVTQAGPGYGAMAAARHERLRAALTRIAPLVDSRTLADYVADRLEIAPTPGFTCNPGRDFCYFKINHGFWEQIYALFGPPDETKMRVIDTPRYRSQYVESGFLAALDLLIRRSVADDGRIIRFPDVHFGVSLGHGMADHATEMSLFPQLEPRPQGRAIGAAIGVTAYFSSLFGDRRLRFCDGSFPKQGLATGQLAATLHDFAAQADRVVFVVPPHLRGIRLAASHLPQERLFVSGRVVHESWAAALAATGRRICGWLASGERLIVIGQAAVFAPLLALSLMLARAAGASRSGRLSFFDLGQVTDIAVPEDGGPWVRRHAIADRSLFRLAPTVGEEADAE
jgi:hypothetical protein